jgi:hypothetical protein
MGQFLRVGDDDKRSLTEKSSCDEHANILRAGL